MYLSFLCEAHLSAFSPVCKTDVIKIVNLYTLFLKGLYFYLGSRLADLHLILPNEVPQLSC